MHEAHLATQTMKDSGKSMDMKQKIINHFNGNFLTFYENYLEDHWERLDAAIGFCNEHGYEPVFFNDGFLGAPE